MCLKFFLCLPCMFMPKAVSNIRRWFSPRLPCGAEKVWYLAHSLLNRVKFISGIEPMNTEHKKKLYRFSLYLAGFTICVCVPIFAYALSHFLHCLSGSLTHNTCIFPAIDLQTIEHSEFFVWNKTRHITLIWSYTLFAYSRFQTKHSISSVSLL